MSLLLPKMASDNVLLELRARIQRTLGVQIGSSPFPHIVPPVLQVYHHLRVGDSCETPKNYGHLGGGGSDAPMTLVKAVTSFREPTLACKLSNCQIVARMMSMGKEGQMCTNRGS